MTLETTRQHGDALPHMAALDGVRGVAIALVLFLHFGAAANFGARSGAAVWQWIDRLTYVGWSGVDLFFVLSGFLITSILVRSAEQPQYFRRFFGRRIVRIFPLYYTYLVLGFFVVPHVWPQRAGDLLQQSNAGSVWLWTYTLNVAFTFGWVTNVGLFNHFWTLAIEEQYYVVWPWVVRYVGARALIRLCLALVAAALVLRLAWIGAGFGWEGAYRFTLTRIDALAAGSASAVLLRQPKWRGVLLRIAPRALLVGLTLIAVLFMAVPRFYPSEAIVVTFGHSILALTGCSFVLTAIGSRCPRWLTGRALVQLGAYSYGIYVWHWPVQNLLIPRFTASLPPTQPGGLLPALVFVLTGITASVFMGVASFHAIEQPFLRLKRYFAYTESSSPIANGSRIAGLD